MANGRSFRSSTWARKMLNASPGFIPRRAKTFSALRKRAVGTRTRKSVVVDMLQNCSNVLKSQSLVSSLVSRDFPSWKVRAFSLPLLCKPGDPAFETFDARRFQFFLYSLSRHFLPDDIVSPEHRGFQAAARFASKYFSQAFAAQPQRSAVTDFLAKPNRRGWEVKRKLVWLGTRSFLFRFAFNDYMRRQEVKPSD